ncbi:MAG: response regulator [Sedimentisphaerales bacterium]|nr:response regulator [Planctomycetota bacterium]MDY0354796.1 response regulator [Sedimentisphaerales bacterium]NLT77907.1 response regulator [Planctomycetota bacterium]
MAERSQLGDVNVLASAANWAWPEALRSLFKPRGINLMVAENTSDFVHILGRTRIHTTIVDMDSERANALATIRIIRMDHPLLPCILLTSRVDQDVLGKALQLDVFGVVGKPVNMEVLQQLLNRLFLKKYNSDIFSR